LIRWLPVLLSIATAIVILSPPAAAQQETDYRRLERAAELIRQQQLVAAEAELQTLLRLSPREANAHNLLGVIRAQQQRPLEAEQFFLRALREAPRLLGVYLNLGRLYLDQHKRERALWAFSAAAKLAPDNSEINYQLASLYEGQHAYERALNYLLQTPRAQWENAEYYLAISCYLNLGRKNDALALVPRVAQGEPVTDEEAVAVAALFLRFNLPDPAIEILFAARQKGPVSPDVLSELGASYAMKADWLHAEETYMAALAARPDDVKILRELARVARAQGELEKALAHLLRARKLAPEALGVLYDFGLTTLQLDLVLDALPAFERLQTLRPNEPAYIYMLAITCFRHDEKSRTEALMRRYIKLRPTDPLGYYVLGASYYSVKRYDEARSALAKALTFKPDVGAEYLLGMIADLTGDTAEALRHFKNVLKSEPLHGYAHAAIGTIYFKQNNYESAKTELEQAVKLNDRDLSAFYQLGLLYNKLGEKARSKPMFERAEQLREAQRNEEKIGFKLIEPPPQ
jgi:tetratricopeptide (TPR) repeat protein